MRHVKACSWLALGLLLGCGRPEAPAESASSGVSAPTGASAPAPSPAPALRDQELLEASAGPPFTLGTEEYRPPPRSMTLLTDVRSARHQDFDRVVFEFRADSRPAYHVQYIDKPVRKCGSGDTTPVAGDAWLEVRFDGVDAHTERGSPTVAERERHVELGVVKELEQTCDFEAQVIWVIGVSRPNKYRVLALEGPQRVVVDIKH